MALSTWIVSWFFLQQLCLNAINSPQSVCSIKNWQMFPKCLLGIFLSVYICSKDIPVFSYASRGPRKSLSLLPQLQLFFPLTFGILRCLIYFDLSLISPRVWSEKRICISYLNHSVISMITIWTRNQLYKP